MSNQPSIPSSKTNPIGQTDRIKQTLRAVFKDIARAQELTLTTVDGWMYTIINDLRANAFYDFFVDAASVRQLAEAISRTLMEGGGGPQIREAVRQSYTEGVWRAADNLSGGLTGNPLADVGSGVDQILRRATLAGSRSFESMKGFSDQTGSDLARVLFEAIQSGENPRQTAKTIRERFDVSKVRAERIARTEITMAQRRGRWDEVREQEKKFGKTIKVLHNSALIPGRTRASHAKRHGGIFTVEEEALWYTLNGNAINCLCSTTEIVMGNDGKPLFGGKLVKRMKEQRKKFLLTKPTDAKV